MCLFDYRSLVVDKDIKVYKVMFIDEEIPEYLSLYFRYPYRKGAMYYSIINEEFGKITNGLHFMPSVASARKLIEQAVYETADKKVVIGVFVIPKGAKAFEGYFMHNCIYGALPSIVSDTAKLIDVIDA